MKLIAGAILILASAISFAGSSIGKSEWLGIFGFIPLVFGIIVSRSGWIELSPGLPEARKPNDSRPDEE